MQFDFPGFILIFSMTVLIALLDLVSKGSVCLPDLSKTREIDLGGFCSAAGDALRGRGGRFYWSCNVILHTSVLPLNWPFHLCCNKLRVAEPHFSLWCSTSLSKKDAHDLPSLLNHIYCLGFVFWFCCGWLRFWVFFVGICLYSLKELR